MFFLFPVGVDYRARRYPVVTFTLMGICAAIYLAEVACSFSGDSHAMQQWEYEYLWLTPGANHWWTYITHMFMHAGLMHLAGNMVYLFLFGSCVEDIIGRLRFVVFYLLTGLAAAFTHILINPFHFASDLPLGGASGAISGCIGGFLLLMLKTQIEFKWVLFFYFRVWNGEFMLPAWLVISFWFLKDLGMMILTMLADRSGGGVAFAAHVGGTLAGMGLISLEKWRMKRAGIERIEIEEDENEAPAAPVLSRAQRVAVAPQPQVQKRYRVGLPGEAATTAAPVAATGEMPTIHLSWNGDQTGPFTSSQIREMFVTGAIPAEAVYWQEGMDDWRTAEELREPGVG